MIRRFARSLALGAATALVAAAGFSQVQPGDQSRWSLDFRASMEQSSANPIEIHLIGDWTSTISAVRAGEYDAQLQLANLQFTGEAVKSAPASSIADLRSRLSRPFWATFRRDGGLIAMHFFRDEAPSDRNLLEMIATELQLVRPDSGRNSWSAQERDGAGEYSALYVMPAPDQILKRKLKYNYVDGVAGAPAQAVHVSISRSDITFLLAPDGAVQQIDGTNRVRMDLSQNQTEQLAAVTEFHASHFRSGHAPEVIGGLERELPNIINSPIVTHRSDAREIRAEADDRLLKGYTTEAILAAAFSKDAGSAQDDRLTALFRHRPDAASAAVAMLIKDGPKRSVTNALGAAGSPVAVAALDGLAHNSAIAKDLRVDAIIAFVQMQHPTAEAMRAPGDLMNDSDPSIQSAARMMSGALAHAGRPEHPAEADAVDASLIALYRNVNETPQAVVLLGALGNSAGPLVVPVIQEALGDSHTAIRSAAARALRLIPGSEIDDLLARIITSDIDPTVRADAVFATRFRRPLAAVLADGLLSAASTDTADYVRSDAIAVLRLNPNSSPRIPDVLAGIAANDKNSGIRRQANEAFTEVSGDKHSKP